jgi:diguanylate cyclase (GGDEF)-like protein/PAS domain S-box-containing protein
MALQWISGVGLLVVAAFALGVAVVEIRRRHRDHGFHAEMLDALDDRVCRFRVDDLVLTYCNEAWARSVGTTSATAIGRPIDEFVTDETVAGLRTMLVERGDDDGESRRDAQLRHVDGRVVFEQWWDRVLTDPKGRRELLCVGRDVTERALIEHRLADSERQHRELIERLPLAAFVRRDRRLVFANQAAAELVGLDEPDQLLDMSLDALFTPDGIDVLDERIARRAAGEPVDPILRARGRTIGGDIRTIDIYTAPIDLDGELCTLAVVNDVTDLVEATSALSRSEERFRALADRSTDVIFRVVGGHEPQVEYVNHAFTTLTGLSVAEFTERPVETVRALLGEREAARFVDVLTSAQGPRSFQLPITHLDGTRRWVDVRRTLTMGRDGSLVVDGTLRDVTVEKSLEETLRDLANVDELTGLPNRRALEDELDRRLHAGGDLSLLFLDLDRFKDVNDTLGHLIGDELLREIGNRLRRSCRADDFVARLAGDEFIVITGTEPEVVADRIRSELAMPLEVGASSLSAQASIGITRATPHDSAVSLLGRADAAMYEVKRSRGRRPRVA